ncbi:MAG: carbohydrate binding domain-containing protein, partial [Clostridia bacterium]|nr:carbohydrate binding domain-containing protein [Clostridia bacterium]
MKYPYLFEDFEDEDIGMFPTSRFNTSEYVACVAGGIDGSSKAMLFKNARAGYAEVQFPLTYTPKVGEIIYLSAWLKTENTNLTNDKLSMIIYADTTVYRTSEDETLPESKRVGGWVEKALTQTGVNKDGWTKVTTSYEWTGAVNARPTAGYNGAEGSEVLKCTEEIAFNKFSLRLYGTDLATDTVDSVNYLIDEVEYYAAAPEKTEGSANIFTNSSFDVNRDGWGIDGNSNSVVVNDANDPAPDGSAGYLKMEPKTDTSKIYGAVSRGATLKMNHMYKVSFWAKLLEAPEGITTGGFWFLQYANKRIVDANGLTTNYPGYIKFNCMPLGEWKHFEFYYLNEYKASTQQQFTTVLRLFAGTDQNNAQHASYCLDEFRCEDLGSVENGDFSVAAAEVDKNNITGKGTEGTMPTAYDVLGWNEDGADITVENGEATVTANDDGGNIWQGINVDNGATYKISFRAKGVGDTVGKAISLKLDRSVSTVSDCDRYDVPDTETLSNNWALTDTWKTYETYYTPAFSLREGMAEEAELIPRLPFMSVQVDGIASGMSYMIDDVVLEKVEERPALSGIEVQGKVVPGEELTVSYQYSHPKGAELGNVLVKATVEGENGPASVGSYTLGGTFTVPEHAFGKDIHFTVMPVDENGVAGAIYEVTAEAPEGAWGKLFYDRKAARASVYYTEDAKATVLVAAYNGNKLIGTEMGEVSIKAYEKASYKLETLTEEGADRLKVMLWNSAEGGKAMADYVEVDCTEPYDVNVYLLGDSLCMSYAISSYPQQGWGYYFHEFFGERATVRNYAVGGRTAVATYYEQKAWPQVKSMAEEGDYLFLALGLNDSGSKADSYDPELTDRPTKFKKYLNLICDEAQELGMTVIFNTLTPTIPQNNAIPRQDA